MLMVPLVGRIGLVFGGLINAREVVIALWCVGRTRIIRVVVRECMGGHARDLAGVNVLSLGWGNGG